LQELLNMPEKTIFKKASGDGKRHYRLVQFDSKYAIFKTTYQNGATEAEFAENLGEFSDKEKAKKFFDKLQ